MRKALHVTYKVAVGVTLLYTAAALTPPDTLNRFGTALGDALSAGITAAVLTLITFGIYGFIRMSSPKMEAYTDVMGYTQYLPPLARRNAAWNRHLAIIRSTWNNDFYDHPKLLTLGHALLPWLFPSYHEQANRIDADKTFPFSEGIVAPKFNPRNRAVVTQNSKHLRDYLDTVGADLGLTYTAYNPHTLHLKGAPGSDNSLTRRASEWSSQHLDSRRKPYLDALALAVLIFLISTTVLAQLISIPAAIIAGFILAIAAVYLLTRPNGAEGPEAASDAERRTLQALQEAEYNRSNIIIFGNGKNWHTLAAQILAITDYVHLKGRSRNEALARIEMVLRSNIFQVEGKNVTPEEAYEWARSELYDFSAVSVAYPNGYAAAGGGEDD